MSLKSFHIFFIFTSIVLSIGVSYWSYQEIEFSSDWYLKPLLVFGLVSAVGLSLYLSSFIKKMRKLPALCVSFLALSYSQSAVACAVCYGDPNSPLTKSTNAGVSFMLVVVVVVLSFFAYGLARLIKKDRQLNEV